MKQIKVFLEFIVTLCKNLRNPFIVYFKNLDFEDSIYIRRNIENTGIVIQGPIKNNIKNINSSVRFYNINYPELKIIISTWETEKKYASLIDQNFNGYIIYNSLPKNPGPSNINLQIISTISGLREIEKMNVKRCLKMRTDLTHLNIDALSILENRFNLTKEIEKSNINKIIVLSQNNFLFRLFGISDLFQYGELDDLIELWDIELDSREPYNEDYLIEKSVLEASKMQFSEVYIFLKYLRKKNFKIVWKLETSIKAFTRYTVPINPMEIGVYWNKYSYLAQRFRLHKNSWKFQEFDFNLWLFFVSDDKNIAEFARFNNLIAENY